MLHRLLRRLGIGRKVVYGDEFFRESWFKEWETLKTVLERLIEIPGCWHRILDFGCGPGVMIDHMNDRGYEYIGCDYSSEAHDLYCCTYGKYPQCYVMGLADMDYRGFDLLLSFDVFEHMHDEEIETVLRLTSPVPELLVNISRERYTPGHVNIKPDKGWLAFFARNGLVCDMELTEQLRRSYETLRPGAPDLWNRNLFALKREPR